MFDGEVVKFAEERKAQWPFIQLLGVQSGEAWHILIIRVKDWVCRQI